MLIKSGSNMLTQQFEESLEFDISATIDPMNFPRLWTTFMFEIVILRIQTKGKDFQNASKSILDLHYKSFICTKFEAFITFSAISTCIRGTRTFRELSEEIIEKKFIRPALLPLFISENVSAMSAIHVYF